MLRLISFSMTLLLASGYCINAFAQTSSVNPIFVQIDPKLGKVVYHRVVKHETLYGIAQIYGVEQDLMEQANPKVRISNYELPSVIKVPIQEEQVHYRIPLFKQKRDFTPVYYVAKRKDNPFRISRVVFDMPTNLLVNRNDIKQNKIREGQKLHIGWLKHPRIPLLVRIGKMSEDESAESKSVEREQFDVQLEDFSVISENQVAFWNQESNSKGLFVMHRTAPARSVIEITNPMHNSIAYAKVIGKLPPQLYSKEIDMIVSKELALELGVVDPKFFVQVRYKGPTTSVSR